MDKALESNIDGARLEALIFLARKVRRCRRGSTWSVEEIENLRVTDLLDHYKREYLAEPTNETPKQRHARKADIAYLSTVQRAFPELCVGDIGELDCAALRQTRIKSRGDNAGYGRISLGACQRNRGTGQQVA